LLSSVLCVFLLGCVFFAGSAGSASADQVEVKGVRQWAGQNSTRIVIDLSGMAPYSKGQLSNPERLFLDVKGAKLAATAPKAVAIGDRLVKSVRLGQFSADTVRIVFDLESGSYDHKVMTLDDPMRLIIDFAQKGRFEQKPELKPEPKDEAIPETKAPPRPESRSHAADVRRKIVIDAGHGGHDPGAVGKGGLYEKDVVLDVALQAKSVLMKQYPNYDVVLTRDRDVFIPLDERAAIANRVGADLFVSVHANASTNRKARGIETYLLNWTNDDESLRVAARENAISLKKMRQVQNDVATMLASLERESKRDESVKLSGYMQNAMISGVSQANPDTRNLGVKQALFYVLVGAKMPSALVEVAFVSNAQEEKLLAKASYRQRIAAGIAAGIHAYFSSSPSQKMADAKAAVASSDGTGGVARPVKYSKLKRRP
jgi:N-acetylmuramoyl-L-alanine amidase